MKKAIDFFTVHPARFFLLAALLWGGFMCFVSIIRGKFDVDGFWVEANGMVFDLLVFGVLLSIYEALREKRDKIERLHEEIDDYRGWDEKEATYRIVGAVRRLNKLGVSKIDLENCYLKKANLINVNLEGANLWGAELMEAELGGGNFIEANFEQANLKGAEFGDANFQGANLDQATLEETNLVMSNFQGARLTGANLCRVHFWGANFKETDLRYARLNEANLQWIKLQGAVVGSDWFEKLEEWNVEGREEIKAKYFIDEEGRLQEKQ